MVRALTISLGFLALLQGRPAHAGDIGCVLAEKGVITVDGLLDDWRGVAGLEVSEGDPGDSGLSIRCDYDEEALYLAVHVTDERVIRSKGGGKGEDHLVIRFGAARLEVYPGYADYDARARVSYTGSGGARVLAVADSLQPKGWAVEVGVPLGRLPGWARGVPAVPIVVELHDADLLVEQKTQAVISTGPSMLTFEESLANFRFFLEENKLRQRDLMLDQMIDMDGRPGLERVVAGGRVIAVFTDEYAYLRLPVDRKEDFLEARTVDLDGQGRASLLVRYVERGNGGAREVLAVFNLATDGNLKQTFAHEITKQMGRSRLTNTWELLPADQAAAPPRKQAKKPRRGKAKAAAGLAIVIRPGDAVGFSEATYQEVPAEDMQPILVPWGERKQEIWTFRDGEVFGP